jgi:NTE family protein
MHIEHIVLSGGGTLGICEVSALHTLFQNKVLDHSHIKSLYGISIGSIIAFALSIKIDISVIQEYIIQRPWNKLFTSFLNSEQLLNIHERKGIYNKEIVIEALKPLIKYSSFDEKITFKEVYDNFNTRLYLYAACLPGLSIVEFSHETHPDMPVMDVIAMSSSIPGVFEPVYYEGKFYIDAGILQNYPLEHCIKREKHIDHILGIRFKMPPQESDDKRVNEDMHIIPYITMFLRECHLKLREHYIEQTIPNEIVIPYSKKDAFSEKILVDKEERIRFISLGKKYAHMFLWYHNIR